MSNGKDERSNQELLEITRQHLSAHHFTYDPSSLSWQENGSGVASQEIKHEVMFAHNIGKMKMDMVMTIIEKHAKVAAENDAKQWVHNIEKLVKPDPKERDAALHRFIKLMERDNTSPQMHDAHVLVMRQWMWQVKRHIIDDPYLPVKYHIAPIFWSREGGTGKSMNVGRLLGPDPLRRFVRTMAVSDLTKPFMTALLANTRVAYLEEFAGANRVETGSLKALLTQEHLEGREIYQAGGIKKKNRLASIATSNLHPPFGFYDETGGRRFWPIHCSGERAAIGSARVNALDTTCVSGLWASVSFEDEAPLGMASPALLKVINEQQEATMRSANSLAQFCRDALAPMLGSKLRYSDFRREYASYCRKWSLGVMPGGQKVFETYLDDLDIKTVHTGNVYSVSGYAWAPGYHTGD